MGSLFVKYTHLKHSQELSSFIARADSTEKCIYIYIYENCYVRLLMQLLTCWCFLYLVNTIADKYA